MSSLHPQSSAVTVLFGENFPRSLALAPDATVVAENIFRERIEAVGARFVDLENLVDSGSVYEASAFLESLPLLTFPDGTPIAKAGRYQGYELWWIHYQSLFSYIALPYTRYRRLLDFLKDFPRITVFHPPAKYLFSSYLAAYDRSVQIDDNSSSGLFFLPPPGIFVQVLLMIFFMPLLLVRRLPLMIYTSDKFAEGTDYDFRMKFIYHELRMRHLPFVECIRSLGSWQTVISHAFKRGRPVLYSEGIAWLARLISRWSGGSKRGERQLKKFGDLCFREEKDPERRFKLLAAVLYLRGVSDDIWGIRLMALILKLIGVRAAFFTAALDRNFYPVLGCKLNNIPTVGILHGVASRFATPYEYMTGFDGEKRLSVDHYGVWSEWWRSHFHQESRAYTPSQIEVSGPMRPLTGWPEAVEDKRKTSSPRVLFIAEQTAAPREVLPYLLELLKQTDISLTIKFRPFHDGFEDWLFLHQPDLLNKKHVRIIKGGMEEAIAGADVVVGCHSTGVLEALLQLKVPIFLSTHKWGDYYGLAQDPERQRLFAHDPADLITKIRRAADIPSPLLVRLREQYFGDPRKNGSAWVVDQLEELLKRDRV